MSQARVHYVKSARQRFAKEAKLDEEGKQVTTAVTRKSGAPRLAKSGRQVVRRIKVADKSKPLANHRCGKCSAEILPGTPYRWYTVGFRGSPSFRCMKSTCSPRPSELESSQVADIMAAMEDAEDQIDALEGANVQDFEQAAQELLQTVQDAIDEVASAYEEADEAMGGTQSTEAYERAETLRGNDLGSFSLSASDPDGCGDEWKQGDEDQADAEDHDEVEDGCEYCEHNVESFLDEARDEVRDALSEVELP